MVTPMRFELMALGLGILRSILLSYGVGGRNLDEASERTKPAQGAEAACADAPRFGGSIARRANLCEGRST